MLSSHKAHRSFSFLILFALLFQLSALGLSQGEMDQALKQEVASKAEIQNQWNFLSSLGWRVEVVENLKQDIQIKAGSPLKLKSFADLKGEKCLALCLQVSGKVKSKAATVAKQVVRQFFPSAIADKASQQAFRLKLATQARATTEAIAQSFEWPYNDEGGWKGTGFTRHFSFMKTTQANVPAEYEELYGYWQNKKSTKVSTAIESLAKGKHLTGCALALSAVVVHMVYKVYDDFTELFDRAYKSVIINNADFTPSDVLPKLDFDGKAKAKIRMGRNGLIGEPGYLGAIFPEKVDEPSYAGENFIIVDMTDQAVKDLQGLKTLGYNRFDEDDLESLEDDDLLTGDGEDGRLMYFDGASFEMIRFWILFSKLKKQTKMSAEDLSEKIKTGEPGRLKGASLKTFKQIQTEIMERPFFKETTIWGHPSHDMTLGEWLAELAKYNPKTPYSIMLYDYDLNGMQWENYKKTFLGDQVPAMELRPAG
ncbi:MAG: hypothetical protein H6624_12960 [Bdellovibrionaceae bacterium]|nr:hypothetical protein [Bdellovibrionales bacterium]MCB9085253.1 hypothetical protein [Pseudobdellovibrionaceae bacterium]